MDTAGTLLLAAGGPAPEPRQLARPIQAFTHLSTGSARLDGLLRGGFPAGASTLLYGPPFTGKQVLQQAAFVAAAKRGIPATFVLHGMSADTMSQRLRALDPAFAQAEASGLVDYVDLHSHFLGEPTDHPNAVYLADPHDAAAIAGGMARRHDGPSLLAIQSASTLLVDLGPARAFSFLRGALGRVQRHGGVGLLCLQAGMHSDPDVQMAKHLCTGMVEMRRKGDLHVLHIEGLDTSVPRPGWIEYQADRHGFRVTGSFAARTIR